MYGRRTAKKIIIAIIIVILLAAIGFGAYYFLFQKDLRLNIEYIGGDKYVDDVLTVSDFKVTKAETGETVSSSKLNISVEPLSVDGTVVTLYFSEGGKTYQGTKKVYPTLIIKEISAEFLPTNKHIGSKISKEDFKVTGKNNKDETVEIKDFTVTSTVLKQERNDVGIEFKTSVGTLRTTLRITVTENFIVGVNAKYIGPQIYAGEDVNDEDFEVYAKWDDDTETAVEEYSVSGTSFSDGITFVTISITDSEGIDYEDDVKIDAVNYVVDIDSVSYIGQEQTIGNSVNTSDFEVHGVYYDGSVGTINNFKISGSKVLGSDENIITISVTNELKEEITYKTVVYARENIIYIGDVRIKELKKYNLSSVDPEDIDKSIHYIYSDKANQSWFNKTAVKEVKKILDKNPYSKFRIVICLGMFDFDNLDKYVEDFSKLAKETWKDHRIFVNSINPVDETQMTKAKKYSRKNINTTLITEYNSKMSQEIKKANITNLSYINTYGILINQGLKTKDGVSYSDELYEFYHDNIRSLT